MDPSTMIFFVYLALLEHEGSSDIINTNERIAKSVSQCAFKGMFYFSLSKICLSQHDLFFS